MKDQVANQPGVGWAILGTGALADRSIAPAIMDQVGCNLVAVYSRDASRGTDFSHRHGEPTVYTDYDELLNDAAVDVVYVATPNSLHAEQGISALNAGKHVLVEKPMALSVSEGRRMLAAADASGVFLGVGFHLRHKPTTVAARDLVAAGEVGSVFMLDVHVAGDKEFYPFDTWRSDRRLSGGGTILNQGTHAFDLVRFVTGAEIVSVTAQVDKVGIEDVFAGVCTLSSGAIAVLSSHQNLRGTRPDYSILGSDGWVEARGGTSPAPQEECRVHRQGEVRLLATSPHSAYWHEVANFTDAARGGARFLGNGHDGLAVIAAANAMYESAESGRTVLLEEKLADRLPG